MIHRLFSLFCFSLLFLSAQAQPARYQAAIDSARSLMERFVAFNDIPGASVSVSVNGEIAWSEGFGYADLEQQVPVYPDRTKFRIGSVSKPIASAAVGVLYDEGKVKLDAPIQEYVPDFPEKRWPVTLRQLSGHLAGVRHYRGEEFLSSKRYATVSEGLAIFAEDTLLFEPGARFSYTSYGYNLISAAVEGAGGEDFLSYMQEAVFDPLGMKNTTADFTDSLIAYRTSYYAKTEDGNIINAPFVDNSYKWAGGGFLSTTEDLVRFGHAHIQPGFLSDATLALWLTPMKTTSGEPTGYGMGWFVGEDGAGMEQFGHAGGSVGGITQLIVYPEPQVVVAMLTNASRVDYGDTHLRIAHLFMPEPLSYPALDEAALQPFLGKYLINGDTPAAITLENGRLYLSRRGGLPQLLIPQDDGSYVTLASDARFRFRVHPEMVVEREGEEEPAVGVKREE